MHHAWRWSIAVLAGAVIVGLVILGNGDTARNRFHLRFSAPLCGTVASVFSVPCPTLGPSRVSYVVGFGTNARKRRGLSTVILWMMSSLTPAYRIFGTKFTNADPSPTP